MSFVTLIRPPTVSSPTAYSVPIAPPIGAAYLAASLRAVGHRVALIDALGEAPLQRTPTRHARLVAHGLTIEEIVARIDPATQGIGLSAMFSQEWPHTDQLIRAIRERLPNVPIIVGGEHATAAWDYILATCPAVDMCGLGEGEQTIVDFARHLDGQIAAADIAGIALRRDGRPAETAPRPRLRALSEIPWPAFDLVPMERYLSGGFGYGVDLGRSMPILATRGCPYRCTFCSNPVMWANRYHMREVTDVVDEIEHCVRRYRATNIDFYDLTAIVRRDWVLDFCRELERRGLDITWQLPSGTRSEALDEEVLRALYRTGCRNITYAPESGSERTLRQIEKKVNLPRMVESIRAAKRCGVNVKCNLIIGFPHETRADVWKTVRLALKLAVLGADDTGVYLFSPYPGSELYRELRARGVIGTMDDDYFASLACFMDLGTASGYCDRIGPRELNAWRLAGMAGFYTLSFLLRPWRALRTAWNVWRSRSVTILEQRLCDMKKRWLGGSRLEAT